MRVPVLIAACAAGLLAGAGGSPAVAQNGGFPFFQPQREQAPPPAPAPRPRSRRDEPRAAPQPQAAPQPAEPPNFFSALFGIRRAEPPPASAAAPPVDARRPPPADRDVFGRRPAPEAGPSERAYREPSDRSFERRRVVARPAPAVRAPKAVVAKPKAVEPTTHVVVFGDSLGEHVKDGLSEIYEDAVEIDVADRTRPDTGLARNDHYDWAKAVSDYFAANPKITVAVMMLGVNDRQPIREGETSHDFLSDRWREIYRDRVDAVVKAFADRRIPLVWVGAPPMKQEKSSAELIALNDIFRERVQRAGGAYVDIWPGFVDDENRYAAVGPDTGGQTARLRTNDGIHFTSAGARKAAFFVETELKRLLGRKDGAPVGTAAVTPAPGESGQPGASIPGTDAIDRLINASLPALPEPSGSIPLSPRPAAGPVVPLTRPDLSPGGTLLGARPKLDGDAGFVVDQALRNGVAPAPKPGRADHFAWPRS